MTAEGHSGAVRLLNEIETLRRFQRLYPNGHPALPTAHARLAAATGALRSAAPLTVAIGPNSFFFDQVEVTLASFAPARRLGQLLFRLGLAALKLTFPAAGQGLQRFAEALAGVHDPPTESDRQGLLEACKGLPGVELIAVDLANVRLVEGDVATREGGSQTVWAELAERLGKDGAFAMSGRVLSGELEPGALADLVTGAKNPEALLDHLFAQLGQIVLECPPARRAELLAQIRAYLEEFLALLDPERRHLAIAAALRHLDREELRELGGPAIVSFELVVETVEYMVALRLPVPEVLERAVRRIAALEGGEDLATLIARARLLIPFLAVSRGDELGFPELDAPAVRGRWESTGWGRELVRTLEENEVRLHLVRVLTEAVQLWPGEDVGKRSTLGLAEELVTAVDLGDLATAGRLAPLLVATRDQDTLKVLADDGVRALVRALRGGDKSQHASLVAILAALGETALPAVLETLAEEDSLTVRKRLLEVVARQGVGALAAVRAQLDDPRWFVVRNAVFILRSLGDRESVPQIKELLPRARSQVVVEILKTLVAFEDHDWFPILRRELDRNNEEHRAAALSVAIRIPHPAVVEDLCRRLRDRSGVRLREAFTLELIRALARLRHPAALDTLRRLAELKQWKHPYSVAPVRREAALAIAVLDGEDAREVAEGLAQDRDPELAAAVRATLRRGRAREVEP